MEIFRKDWLAKFAKITMHTVSSSIFSLQNIVYMSKYTILEWQGYVCFDLNICDFFKPLVKKEYTMYKAGFEREEEKIMDCDNCRFYK